MSHSTSESMLWLLFTNINWNFPCSSTYLHPFSRGHYNCVPGYSMLVYKLWLKGCEPCSTEVGTSSMSPSTCTPIANQNY